MKPKLYCNDANNNLHVDDGVLRMALVVYSPFRPGVQVSAATIKCQRPLPMDITGSVRLGRLPIHQTKRPDDGPIQST